METVAFTDINVSEVLCYGNDSLVVSSATGTLNGVFGGLALPLSDANVRMLKRMGEKVRTGKGHWTPFAQAGAVLTVEIPIFLARQYIRSTVGAAHVELSRRWSKTPFTFWNESREDEDLIRLALQRYEEKLQRGERKEKARAVLPHSLMTRIQTNGSLAYWARVYGLRHAKDAQEEWKFPAEQLDRILRFRFPESWAALVDE